MKSNLRQEIVITNYLKYEHMDNSMEDRIEVDGVWYIKEEVATSKFEKVTISELGPGVRYDGFVFESNLYAFDCTRIDWMCGIIENEVEAIGEAMESLCSQGFVELKEVLTTLRVAAWI